MFLPPAVVRHGLAALDQAIPEADGMDAFVYESARDGMLAHVDSGYEEVDWNSKPFLSFILLLPKYLEDNHRALTAPEIDAIFRAFAECRLRRVLRMVQDGFVHEAICAELDDGARRMREMLARTRRMTAPPSDETTFVEPRASR